MTSRLQGRGRRSRASINPQQQKPWMAHHHAKYDLCLATWLCTVPEEPKCEKAGKEASSIKRAGSRTMDIA